MADQNDTTTLNSPQSLVDDVLNTPVATTTIETTTVSPLPSQFVTHPPLPTSNLAPLNTTTTTSETAKSMVNENVSMGDDTPLAFASLPSAPATTTTTTTTTPPLGAADTPFVPPLPEVEPTNTTTTTMVAETPKKKSKLGKIMALFFGFVLLGTALFGGYWYYDNYLIERATIAEITEKSQCNGCKNGGWLVWRNGQCKVTGICGSTVPGKNTDNPTDPNSKASCESSGYTWCSATDAGGKSYAFCNTTGRDGVPINSCNNLAAEKGYTILIGQVGCKCTSSGSTCTSWSIDDATLASINNASVPQSTKDFEINRVKTQCTDQKGSFVAAGGTEKYICKLGVAGSGGVVYTGGSCTAQNGKTFTGNVDCFCGTVQIDTPSGHTSYTSTCGCNTSTTTTTETPTMSCTGLTRSPITTPVIGTKLTFTCAGVVTPSTAGTLSYKFRYSLNAGATIALANKTTTTAELTIAACGSYSVQCQACATLNGVLTCNPTWAGATTQ